MDFVAGGARTCIKYDTSPTSKIVQWTCRRVINLANRLLVQKVTFLVVPDFDFFSDGRKKQTPTEANSTIPHWNSRINPESTMMIPWVSLSA
jgi:hypothetical protein